MAILSVFPQTSKPMPAALEAHAGSRRRTISPPAGHALEILGHAIDYLTDEYVQCSGAFRTDDPELEAVQLLMAVNRAIYFECPEVPTLGERWKKLIGIE
jgi:hypothetical protein